jgi:hypothetical protein
VLQDFHICKVRVRDGAYDSPQRAMTRLYNVIPGVPLARTRRHGEVMQMNERQQRRDEPVANAAARGLSILAVRNVEVARRCTSRENVPDHVMARVLDHPALR